MDEVVFQSRYGDERVLKKLSENTYSIMGKSHYGRAGNNPNGEGLQFIDFEGGPFVCLGTEMSFFGAKDDRKISKVEFIQTEAQGEDNTLNIRVTVA